jgi:hypothetical protein
VLVDLHRLLAYVVLAAAIALAAVAVGGRVTGRSTRLWTDRVILALLLATAIGTLVGLGLLASGGEPADPLHFVYAIAALATVPVARAWATGTHAGRRWLAVTVAAAVVGGLVYRLFVTGG